MLLIFLYGHIILKRPLIDFCYKRKTKRGTHLSFTEGQNYISRIISVEIKRDSEEEREEETKGNEAIWSIFKGISVRLWEIVLLFRVVR